MQVQHVCLGGRQASGSTGAGQVRQEGRPERAGKPLVGVCGWPSGNNYPSLQPRLCVHCHQHPTCGLHDLAVPLQHRLGDVSPAGTSVLLQPAIYEGATVKHLQQRIEMLCHAARELGQQSMPHSTERGTAVQHRREHSRVPFSFRQGNPLSTERGTVAQHSTAQHNMAQRSAAHLSYGSYGHRLPVL